MPFFDIFSKKRENENKERVIIDIREKNCLIPSILMKMGVQINFQHLKKGDYISGSYIIERKTIADLESSIINKRIFFQLDKLKNEKNFLLLIEGRDFGEIISENAFRGFVLNLILNKNVKIIFSKDEEDSAKYLLLMAKERKTREISFRESKKFESENEIAEFILEGFPDIGKIKAKQLLKRFGSLRGVFEADVEELEEFLGSRAQKFAKTLRNNYS